MLPPLPDSDLMRDLQSGQTKALAVLLQRYQTPLFQFFLQLGEDEISAEDFVQETFLRLYEKRHTYKEQGNFRAYLYRLARNLWIDALRQRRKSQTMGEEPFSASLLHQAQEVPLDVQWALEQLSPKLRETLVLKLYHNLKYEEIAQVLEVPVGTVKSRMAAAFQGMRQLLAAYEEEKE